MNKQELIQQIAISVSGSAFLSETHLWMHDPDACKSWDELASEIAYFSEVLASKLIDKREKSN